MSGAVELVVGPARCGKTALLLERYRQAMQEASSRGAAGATLWLTPTRRSRRAVLAALPGHSLRAYFAPNIFTFDDFAERVLESSGAALRPLSETARRLLVSYLVGEFSTGAKLRYFAPIARTAGFVDLVVGFISELKRNEIWPERFLAACRAHGQAEQDVRTSEKRGGLTDKDRELALVYERYQEILNQHGLYDAEGRFWSARNVLKEGCRSPFEELSLVVVDGFADFTQTQYEIITHLAGWADRVLISLPSELQGRSAPLIRHDLFAKSTAEKNRLADTLGNNVRILEPAPASEERGRPNSIRHLADYLFTNPRIVPQPDNADGIEILAVTGQGGEVRAVAERVKRLLISGIGPDEIVVAVRSLDDYADLIEETFSAAGIPFGCAPAGSFAHSPILKALMTVLQLEVEDWPFERLKSLLLSNYLLPNEGTAWDRRQLVRTVSALRRIGVASGRESYLQALARVAHNADDAVALTSKVEEDGQFPADDREARALAARDAIAVLERLVSATERLRVRAGFADWAKLLMVLADDLGISPRRDLPEHLLLRATAENDRTVWRQFEEMLFDAARTIALLNTDSQNAEHDSLTLSDFTAQLTDLLRVRRLPYDAHETGRVLVLEAADVRNLEIPYLFLAGLTESSFPRARHDDCLYNEAERRNLNAQGLTLVHRSAHSQNEMLLFYQVVTRARRRLILSYPSVSSSGLPLFPSPYLAAIRELFEPQALEVQSVGDLDPVPAADAILTSADLRIAATEGVRANRPGLFRTLCEQPQTSSTGRNILAAVDTAVSRFHTRGFTAYEGRLGLPQHAKQLAERFPAKYQFSATQLEQYAFCPFRFFLSNVLGIAPLESVQTTTDYLGRGILVHDVLAEMHRPTNEPIEAASGSSKEMASIVERFRELVDRELDRRVGDSKLQAALCEIERLLLHDWAGAYGDQWAAYREEFSKIWESLPQTLHVETAFGDAPGGAEGERETTLESLVFGSGSSQTRVRGRIDRVDAGLVENQPVFNVIDYKTGSPPRFDIKDVAAGRSLQLALYTLAVMRHELAGKGATPFQMGYWSLRESGYVSGLKGSKTKTPEALTSEAVQALEQTLEELVPRLAAGIRSGDFPVSSLDDECTGRCPYNMVCRVNQIRPLEESLDKRRTATEPNRAEG